MSREIRRVPVDFDWPLKQVWSGYLMPDALCQPSCPDCDHGYSAPGRYLHNLWYGQVPFDPVSSGSTPLTADTPVVRERAERNLAAAPEFYGTGDVAIRAEAWRLADLWNARWSHHLTPADVDALVAANRLRELTHDWTREQGWGEQVRTPSTAEVNSWSLQGFGHDSINAMICVQARCEREGLPYECSTCNGMGHVEAYPGQEVAAEAWERTDPPTGDGWQVWETTSEGSPISPVFADRDGLVEFLMSDRYFGFGTDPTPLTREQAEAFVNAGSSFGSMVVAGGVMIPGDAAVHELGGAS